MHELVHIVSPAEHWDIESLANPFEQNLENAETPRAQDCTRPDNDQRRRLRRFSRI